MFLGVVIGIISSVTWLDYGRYYQRGYRSMAGRSNYLYLRLYSRNPEGGTNSIMHIGFVA